MHPKDFYWDYSLQPSLPPSLKAMADKKAMAGFSKKTMNDFILVIALVIGGYFLLVFVGARLVVPFMGFRQYAPPAVLPPKIKQTVFELENKSHDQMSYLEAVYGFITDKTINQWKHTRFKAATNISRAFIKDLDEIWESRGFIYCTAINFVAYALIANSKFFNASDVKIKHVFLNFVPHQYLQVKVGEQWVDFDPAGSGIRGGKIGTHASFFG